MIWKIILIGDAEDHKLIKLRDIVCDPLFISTDEIEIQFLDTGSKKTQRTARSYLSKYAASEIFVVMEDANKKVLGVVYKEEINNENTWGDVIMKKIMNINK